MSFSKDVILTLVILAVVLESDLGRKKVGWFRIARPIVVAAVIVPIYFKNLPTSGHNPLLWGLGLLIGIVFGLTAVSPLFVSVGVDSEFRGWLAKRRGTPGKPAAVTVAGAGYAVVWIAVSAARLIFSYGAIHFFPHALNVFLRKHQLSYDSLTDALIFVPVGMDVFRSVGLLTRGSSALREERVERRVSQAR